MTSSPPVASISDFYNLHRGVPSDTLSELEKKYGEIYGLLPMAFTASRISSQTYVVNTHMLASEILRNQDRFPKAVAGPLSFVRNYLTRNALLTADHQEHNDWTIAHKILSPWFAPKRIPKWAFNGVDDITQQLALKWQRFGSSYLIDPSEEFSRLVLDVVGLSLLNWRFNSFYDSQPVPFAVMTNEFVKEAVKSSMAIRADWAIRHADMDESNLGQTWTDRPPIDSGIVAEAYESNSKLILEYLLKTGKPVS
ncbi:cytochrome P450 family protein [Ceratobasidium sp. AG-Ba]|nr:cytochrome P450 family protein [Ceratobasidium sp. AG-Ba]